ncbi:hypothetical protein [Nocardia stercoris]|uniref:DUF4267 domain-containing protein n=1 Tax=Nocardia stercoris TaxID=2483361 RepID=A0A3M2KSY2_9NOCA|nr:hypothetical protein [Nocardia stercoris]RMI27776.1 hypothetical protein EBN03_32890 [Nocardia stercoris]
MRATVAPRIAGLATAAYGAAVAVRPALLLDPCGWPDTDRRRLFARALGWRDLLSGAALAAAPRPGPLRAAVLVRVGADVSDAVLFGVTLRGTPQRHRAVAVAVSWAALCAATWFAGEYGAARAATAHLPGGRSAQ